MGCKSRDIMFWCTCSVAGGTKSWILELHPGGEKNKFWAPIDCQQPAWRNGWSVKASPGNRTSTDQRPRGELEEASWVGEESWPSTSPKWRNLSIRWSGSFWVSFIFCRKNKLCCCSFIFCWIVTFWSKFNQTLLLLVHILDEIELLLFLVHCVKSWNLLVLTVMEKL